MDTAALQSRIQDLLTEGQLEQAIALLVVESREMKAEVHREAVALSGRLKSLEKAERLGTATVEEVRVDRNRLLASVLALLSQLEENKTDARSQKRSLIKIIVVGGAGVILLALTVWGVKKLTTGPTSFEVHLVDSESQQLLTDLIGDTLTLTSGQSIQKALIQNGVATFEKAGRSVAEFPLRFQLSGNARYTVAPGSGPFELQSAPLRVPVIVKAAGKSAGGSDDLNIQIEGNNNQLFKMGDSSTVNQTINH